MASSCLSSDHQSTEIVPSQQISIDADITSLVWVPPTCHVVDCNSSCDKARFYDADRPEHEHEEREDAALECVAFKRLCHSSLFEARPLGKKEVHARYEAIVEAVKPVIAVLFLVMLYTALVRVGLL